jgi:hypothetical protein
LLLYGFSVLAITVMKKLLLGVFLQFCHCIHSTVYNGTKISFWSYARTYSVRKNVDTDRFHSSTLHGYVFLGIMHVILQRSVVWLKVNFRNWTYPLLYLFNVVLSTYNVLQSILRYSNFPKSEVIKLIWSICHWIWP